jgi:hypothetical protein
MLLAYYLPLTFLLPSWYYLENSKKVLDNRNFSAISNVSVVVTHHHKVSGKVITHGNRTGFTGIASQGWCWG